MPQVLKIPNKNLIFDYDWIAGVDYDTYFFDNDEYDEKEDTYDDKKNDANYYKYDKMDKNELANILQEPNKFQVPHETEEEQEIVFKLPEDNAEEDLLKYSEGEYDPEYEEDISLEADDKYGKEEDNQGRR